MISFNRSSIHRMLSPLQWGLAVFPWFLFLCSVEQFSASPAYSCALCLIAAGCLLSAMHSTRWVPVLLFLVVAVLYGRTLMSSPVLLFLPAISCCIVAYLARAHTETVIDRHVRFGVGIIGYLMIQFGASRPNQPAFNLIARHFPYILVAFLLFFLLFLLEGTRIVVTDAAMQRVTPSAVLQRNRMLVCAGFAVALAISLIPTVATALAAIGNTLKLGIKKLLLLLSSLLPSMESGATGTPQASQDLSGMIESSDPSLFAIWSERILLVLAFIAAVIVIFFLLRFLFRKLKLLLGILVERFSGFLQSTTEDYVDEVTDLRDIDEHREHLRLRKKKRVLSQHPTDAQLVRYAYGRYLDQNKQIRQSQTARESLSLADAKIYERVRYGLDQGVDKQDLERFIDHLHN